MSAVSYQSSQNTTATVYTAATEVVAIVTGDPVNTLDAEGQGVNISGSIVFTAGATPGTVTLRVRQGNGLTGTAVATIVVGTTVAATNFNAAFNVTDPTPLVTGPGNSGVPIYTVTLTVAGSNGTGVFAGASVVQNGGQN